MKAVVSKECILFKFSFFCVKVPREGNEINFHINDLSESIGIPIQLMVIPKKYETSFIGKIMLFLFYFFDFQYRTIYIPPSLGKSGSIFDAIPPLSAMLRVEGKDTILSFLNDLKVYSYDVDAIIENFNTLIQSPPERKNISGTYERKRDRLLLVVFASLFFFSGFTFLFLARRNFQDLPTFIMIIGITVVLCSCFYLLLRRR